MVLTGPNLMAWILPSAGADPDNYRDQIRARFKENGKFHASFPPPGNTHDIDPKC